MYVVSFRIPVGYVANQNVFVNGASSSDKEFKAGEMVMVRWKNGGNLLQSAEVIDSRRAGRNDYAWEIVG